MSWGSAGIPGVALPSGLFSPTLGQLFLQTDPGSVSLSHFLGTSPSLAWMPPPPVSSLPASRPVHPVRASHLIGRIKSVAPAQESLPPPLSPVPARVLKETSLQSCPRRRRKVSTWSPPLSLLSKPRPLHLLQPPILGHPSALCPGASLTAPFSYGPGHPVPGRISFLTNHPA